MRNTIFTFLFFTVFSLSINAAIYESSSTVTTGAGASTVTLKLDLSINTGTNIVTITAEGPSAKYFSFGFNATFMSGGTYAIVYEGDGDILEKSLGTSSAGSTLASSLTLVSNSVTGSIRTVVVTRAIVGASGSYYTFPTSAATVPFIYANGSGADYAYHGSTKGASSLMTVLPVDLIDFNASTIDNKIQLKWNTAQELNNEKFIIERSFDSKIWEEITEIEGNGTVYNISNYSYTDKTPYPGINYYRIKQIDYDGRINYSNVIGVELSSVIDNEDILIFPTITSNRFNIKRLSDFSNNARIQVLNSAYYPIMDIMWGDNNDQLDINLENFPSGPYFIIIKHQDWQTTELIIKQ